MSVDIEKILHLLEKEPFTRLRQEVLEKALEAIEEKCKKCQNDRMRMFFAPLCGRNRPLLTVQILAGVRSLPICIHTRASEVKQLLKEIRKPSEIFDAVLPLNIFLKEVLNSKKRKITTFLEENKIPSFSYGNYTVFQIHSILCVYNDERNIVIVNPQQFPIETIENAYAVVNFLLNTRKINANMKILGNLLLMDTTFDAQKVNPSEIIKTLYSKFMNIIEHISADSGTLLLDLNPIGKNHKMLVKLIENLCNLLKG